jgi:hypothetical protein
LAETTQQRRQIVAVEQVVAQHQRDRLVADEFAADDEGLREPVGRGLHRVGELQAPARAVAEQLAKARRVLRRGDDEDVADPGEHERAQGIVDHRLVVHGQQLLRDDLSHRVEARARAAGEDDALHAAPLSA